MTGPGTSDRSAAAPTDDQVTAVPVAPGGADAPSPRLYNRDLAPTTVEGRSWKAYNIFTLWAVDVHSLGNYGFALGLFALGLGAWQILVSLGIGALVLFVLLTVAGYMGYRTGLPFPVMSRISFGVRGAQLPALVRGAVAIAWFGIQTYLATQVLVVMVLAGASLWTAIYGTFVLNFCDFTRGAVSTGAVRRGSFWGILPNTLFFGVVVVVLAGGQLRIGGQVISSPADVVNTIPNTPLLLLASAALLILTIAVNLMANFVAPCYALSNLFPKVLDFRRAGVVSALIGLVILPWNLYDSPLVITYFLGVLGALLGPLFGIVMADYWLVRRGRIDVPALYSEASGAAYHYRGGVNRRAVAVFVPSALVAVAVGFVPALEPVAPFSWFLGAGLAALLTVLVAPRGQTYRAVSGEPLAVAPTGGH